MISNLFTLKSSLFFLVLCYIAVTPELTNRHGSLLVPGSIDCIESSQSVRATQVIGVLVVDSLACSLDTHFMRKSVFILYPSPIISTQHR